MLPILLSQLQFSPIFFLLLTACVSTRKAHSLWALCKQLACLSCRSALRTVFGRLSAVQPFFLLRLPTRLLSAWLTPADVIASALALPSLFSCQCSFWDYPRPRCNRMSLLVTYRIQDNIDIVNTGIKSFFYIFSNRSSRHGCRTNKPTNLKALRMLE